VRNGIRGGWILEREASYGCLVSYPTFRTSFIYFPIRNAETSDEHFDRCLQSLEAEIMYNVGHLLALDVAPQGATGEPEACGNPSLKRSPGRRFLHAQSMLYLRESGECVCVSVCCVVVLYIHTQQGKRSPAQYIEHPSMITYLHILDNLIFTTPCTTHEYAAHKSTYCILSTCNCTVTELATVKHFG